LGDSFFYTSFWKALIKGFLKAYGMAPFYAYVIILGGKKIIPLSLSGDQKNLVTIRQWGYVKWQLKFFHCQKGGVHVRSFFNLKKSSPTRPPPPMPS
jgi:hypothetical protein